MRPFLDKIHTFLSLSGPHLGMLYPTSSLVSTGKYRNKENRNLLFSRQNFLFWTLICLFVVFVPFFVCLLLLLMTALATVTSCTESVPSSALALLFLALVYKTSAKLGRKSPRVVVWELGKSFLGIGGWEWELAHSLQTLSDLQYQLGQENDSGAGNFIARLGKLCLVKIWC